MKRIALSFIVASFLSVSVAYADTYVKGYTRQDGTSVQGHYRSDSNSTKSDNWSTKGNVNPYTGEAGTKTYDTYNNNNQKKNRW